MPGEVCTLVSVEKGAERIAPCPKVTGFGGSEVYLKAEPKLKCCQCVDPFTAQPCYQETPRSTRTAKHDCASKCKGRGMLRSPADDKVTLSCAKAVERGAVLGNACPNKANQAPPISEEKCCICTSQLVRGRLCSVSVSAKWLRNSLKLGWSCKSACKAADADSIAYTDRFAANYKALGAPFKFAGTCENMPFTSAHIEPRVRHSPESAPACDFTCISAYSLRSY